MMQVENDFYASAPSVYEAPSTRASRAALDFIVEHEPRWLVNHSIRSYLFARQFGELSELIPDKAYDDELLFIGTILHDIGLTPEANGSQRFEVDGADRAAAFVLEQGLGEVAADIVWDAVALHTSPGIANRKRPEIALAHAGIGADIFEFGAEQIDSALVATAHQSFPRLGLRRNLIRTVTNQILENTAKHVPCSFPLEAVRIGAPDCPLPGIGEIVSSCAWQE